MSTSDKWRKARRRDLSASRPAEAGSSQAKPGQERRVRLKDPAATGATLPGLTTLSPETATARAPGAEERSAKTAELEKRRSGLNPSPERASSAVSAMAPGAEERSMDLVSTGNPNKQWLDTGDLRWSLAFGSMEDD